MPQVVQSKESESEGYSDNDFDDAEEAEAFKQTAKEFQQKLKQLTEMSEPKS